MPLALYLKWNGLLLESHFTDVIDLLTNAKGENTLKHFRHILQLFFIMANNFIVIAPGLDSFKFNI